VASITVSVVVDATAEQVWADLSDIRTHVEWMADAASIRFTSMRRHGVGTSFDCVTRVGPIRLTDKMVCTEWIPGEVIGMRHVGIVTGTGRLVLGPAGAGTRVTWTETLRFPWMLAGPVGATIGKPVLARIWQGNLARLAERFRRPSSTRAGPPRHLPAPPR
jgi:carbon monoxide dehydrogenase subunit G